jgi:deazaflavin-dependent oxidoreductase (nitroreductase family)
MKSLSRRAHRPLLSREAIGRALGGWPIWLHEIGLGRLAGGRYLVISSVGRSTGRVRRAAVMVLRDDASTGEIFVVAGTHETHWYRNVCAQPAVEVWRAGKRFRPVQRLLTTTEVAALLLAVRRDHPREARIQAAFFGWPWPSSPGEVTLLAAGLGGVAFRPAAAGAPALAPPG